MLAYYNQTMTSRTDQTIFSDYCLTQALKIGAACLICILIVARFNIPSGFMALLPITVIPVVFPHEIFGMILERFLGALLGAVCGWCIFMYAPNLYVASCLVFLVLFGAFFCFVTHRFHYAMVMFSITFGVLYLLMCIAPSEILDFALWWPLNILLGITIIVIVEGIFKSRYAYEKLKQLTQIFLKNPLQLNLNHFKYMLLAAKTYVKPEALKYYQQQLPFMQSLQEELALIESLKASFHQLPALKELFMTRVDALVVALEHSLENREHVSYFQNLLTEFNHYFSSLRHEEAYAAIAWQELAFLFDLQQALVRADKILAKIFLIESTTVATPVASAPAHAHATRTDIKSAFTMSLSMMVVMWAVVFLGLPGSVQPVIAAVVAVSQPNLGRASKQIGDRLVGLTLGSMVAVLYAFILSQLPHLWMLMLLYFFGIVLASYVALYSKKFYYVALQAGVALTLVLTLNTTELVPSLDILVQRIAGLFGGYFIAIVIITLIFPKDPVALLPNVLQKLFKKCASFFLNIEGESKKAELVLVGDIKKVLTEIETFVNDMRFEVGVHPALLQTYQTWYRTLKDIQNVIEKIVKPQQQLMFSELGRELTQPIQESYAKLASALELLNDHSVFDHLYQENCRFIDTMRAHRASAHLNESQLSAYWLLLLGFNELTQAFAKLVNQGVRNKK